MSVMEGVSHVLYHYECYGRSFPCALASRSHGCWGGLLLKMWKMGWLERDTMLKMLIINEVNNTFKPITLLLMFIDFLEAKCFLSHFITIM